MENNRNSLCVVLAGYRDAMTHLMAADPGLVRRFPTALHLEDYTPAQLAAIARQTAHARYGLSFGDGLEARPAAPSPLALGDDHPRTLAAPPALATPRTQATTHRPPHLYPCRPPFT